MKALLNLKNNNSNNKIKYDLIAHLYSLFTGFLFLFSGYTEGRLRKKAYEETLVLNGNEKILDLCCANGKGSRIIASLTPNGKVIGIDLNPAMVSFAHSKSLKNSNITFRIGNCAKIPFEDNSFDLITAALALHEIPTKSLKKVFSEIRRVLKPEAYLYVFDFSLPKKRGIIFRVVYSALRLIEDESAARFMMVNQIKLFKREHFEKIHQKSYYSGIILSSLYKKISEKNC